MGIRTIPQQDWLHIHCSYPSYIRLRQARHEIYKEHSVRTLPSASKRNELAALEVARAIAGFLANRYPSMFEVSPKGAERSSDGWDIRGVRRFAQPHLNLEERKWTLLDLGKGGDDPMKVAGELLPDDLAIMMADEEGDTKGQYRFVAGSVCTPGFWRLDEKLGEKVAAEGEITGVAQIHHALSLQTLPGLTLQQIHIKGKVAQYETKLMHPMDRWFSKLNPNSLAERNNYFFQVFNPRDIDPKAAIKSLHDGTFNPSVLKVDDPHNMSTRGHEGHEAVRDDTELSWSHTTNGPENLFDQSLKTSVPVEGVAPPDPPAPARGPQDVAMRSERQSLRRFPRSGAVLFTVRTYLTPVTTMAEEKGVPGRLASAMRSWPDDIAWYKAAELYRDIVLPYLDAKHLEQVQKGWVKEGEDEDEVLKARRAYPL